MVLIYWRSIDSPKTELSVVLFYKHIKSPLLALLGRKDKTLYENFHFGAAGLVEWIEGSSSDAFETLVHFCKYYFLYPGAMKPMMLDATPAPRMYSRKGAAF